MRLAPLPFKLLFLLFKALFLRLQRFDIRCRPSAGVFRFTPRRFRLIPLRQRPVNRFLSFNDILPERPDFNGHIDGFACRADSRLNRGCPVAGRQRGKLLKLRLE